MTDVSDDLVFQPVHRLVKQLDAGTLKAGELLDAFLERIEQHDDRLHAFVEVYADTARDSARSLGDTRTAGSMAGMPMADIVFILAMAKILQCLRSRLANIWKADDNPYRI